jgi:lipoprotein signal peptidase
MSTQIFPARGSALLAVGVLATDQLTKAAAPLLSDVVPRMVLPLSNPHLSLAIVKAPRWSEVAAMMLVLVALFLLSPVLLRRTAVPAWALAATVAGAASNIVDRVFLGAVRDWMILGPLVINVADLAVLLGLALALVSVGVAQFRSASSKMPRQCRQSRRTEHRSGNDGHALAR